MTKAKNVRHRNKTL